MKSGNILCNKNINNINSNNNKCKSNNQIKLENPYKNWRSKYNISNRGSKSYTNKTLAMNNQNSNLNIIL